MGLTPAGATALGWAIELIEATPVLGLGAAGTIVLAVVVLLATFPFAEVDGVTEVPLGKPELVVGVIVLTAPPEIVLVATGDAFVVPAGVDCTEGEVDEGVPPDGDAGTIVLTVGVRGVAMLWVPAEAITGVEGAMVLTKLRCGDGADSTAPLVAGGADSCDCGFATCEAGVDVAT